MNTQMNKKNIWIWIMAFTISLSLLTGCGSDTKNVKLIPKEPVAAPLTGYELHADEGVIYNPLSREAQKTGMLNLYDHTEKTAGVIENDFMKLEYSFPKTIRPYDIVPLEYTLTRKSEIKSPVTVSATAFEKESQRNGRDLYDLSIPGELKLDFEYLGYVTGTLRENARNYMSPDNTDSPAAQYPNYDTTPLIRSSDVQAGDVVWLRFRFTNTGNSILDPEGIGGFAFYPQLEKKDADGKYIHVGVPNNMYIRELTYVYPGESREFWVNFITDKGGEANKTPQSHGLTEGKYRVVMRAFYRTEEDYQPYVNIWDGRWFYIATMEFTASDRPAVKEPRQFSISMNGKTWNSPSWLHYFEEFMTSYEQYRNGLSEEKVSSVLYIQSAPWTEQIVAKLITSEPAGICTAVIPVIINDDLTLIYNAQNKNYVVENGLKQPVIFTQSMADMRANIQVSPYPAESIVKDMLDMKSCGVNVITTTGMPWLYDCFSSIRNGEVISNTFADAIKYSSDVARLLEIKQEGMGVYPLGRLSVANIAKWISGRDFTLLHGAALEADYSDPNLPIAAGITYLYQMERFGDNYWRDPDNILAFSVEDTRGWMRYDIHTRFPMGDSSIVRFQEWVRKKYTNIEAVNLVWGSAYRSFEDINPEDGQKANPYGHKYEYRNRNLPFHDWNAAVNDLDEFRTQMRIKNYNDLLAEIRKIDPYTKMALRTEGGNAVVAGIDPTVDNDHYRHAYYSQRRNAIIAEDIIYSKLFRSHSDYTTLPYTPSEVHELISATTKQGIESMWLPQFDNMRDVVINSRYGDENYTIYYNTTNKISGAMIHVLCAVYPWWKATYDAGGVPGILWQDLLCDGFVTETQMKEMQYFKAKMDAALNTKKALADRKKIGKPVGPSNNKVVWNYEQDFIQSIIDKVKKSTN